MKISDGFDARRLRPKGPRHWRLRLTAGFAALLALAGLVVAVAGAAGLFGHAQALGELNASPGGAAVLVVTGLLVLWLGVWLWRRCRRRLRQPSSLNLASHLLKKHN